MNNTEREMIENLGCNKCVHNRVKRYSNTFGCFHESNVILRKYWDEDVLIDKKPRRKLNRDRKCCNFKRIVV